MIARADDPAAALTAGESAFAEFLDRLLGEASLPAGLRRHRPESELGGPAAPSFRCHGGLHRW
jgi:hypothetical protein